MDGDRQQRSRFISLLKNNMQDIFQKITSYNLFNYLLPGVLFVAILEKFTVYSLTQDNLVIGAFVYYFVGLVISRFGSLVIEPVLKKVSFLKFGDHGDFISASKNDPKIETLVEASNMYRTFTAMFFLLILAKAYEFMEYKLPTIKSWDLYILVGLLLIMFLLSYRKQTQYITKRIANR